MSTRYKRNQRLKCNCSGYHFPHRVAGGACDYSPKRRYYQLLRQGISPSEASVEVTWNSPGNKEMF